VAEPVICSNGELENTATAELGTGCGSSRRPAFASFGAERG